MSEKTVQLDLRGMPVFQRHPRVFEELEALEGGETLRITNDHDPRPLFYQFEREFKDKCDWEYVKEGPGEWVVDIKKLEMEDPGLGDDVREKVEEALEEVRPYLQADGGDVELVDIDAESRVVKVRLKGACGGCPSAQMTLKAGVEKTIRKYAPGIRGVEAV